MNSSIRDAIRQNKPFDSLQTEVLLTLMRTADLLVERSHRPLCEAGLTTAQYNVLRILRGAGTDGLQTYQVAERLVTRAPNITRLVDKLEAKGLLSRLRSREDRRVVQLRVTDVGLQLLAELDAPVTAAAKEALRGLDETELRELCQRLDRLRQPLEAEASR
jgi:DNA-binding MarR family transcriptional regulator